MVYEPGIVVVSVPGKGVFVMERLTIRNHFGLAVSMCRSNDPRDHFIEELEKQQHERQGP